MFEKLKDIVYEYFGSLIFKFFKKVGIEKIVFVSENVYLK